LKKIDEDLNLSKNEESKNDITLDRVFTDSDEILDPLRIMDINMGNISVIPGNFN
jgi:hypothetical protein